MLTISLDSNGNTEYECNFTELIAKEETIYVVLYDRWSFKQLERRSPVIMQSKWKSNLRPSYCL